MNTTKMIVMGLALAICAALPAGARAAGIDTNTAALPPDGYYLSAPGVHATYSGAALEIVLQDIAHQPFVGTTVRTPIGNDEREDFQSALTGYATVDPDGPGPQPATSGIPVSLTGPTTTLVTNRLLSTSGLFDAEIVSMSLSGNVGGVPVTIREDPTQASTGETDVLDLGGGLYHIDSFFDVFTELSVDGGVSWIAADDDVRVTLYPTSEFIIPEPSTLVTWALALVGLAFCGRRRRKR
jgi:hypothetical protein